MHDASSIVGPLVAWYREHARQLPWRTRPTPYRVLLSELMCQQTRVETALPYFERFLARWPTLADLAAATEEEVVREWSGLGYYSRARNLLRCARAAEAAGGLPSDPAGLKALPGIGPYTAGAVASIAFGVRAAVVDGNVERVLSRLDGRDADPRSTTGRKALWARAAELHVAWDGHPGDLNQALMELGATVCTPRRPSCPRCPLVEGCVARNDGTVDALPRKAKKKPPVPIVGAAGVLRRDGRWLLARRAGGGLLGGLWEPVRVAVPDGGDATALLAHGFAGLGLEVAVGAEVGRVVHVFSHRKLTCRVFAVTGRGTPRAGGDYDDVRLVDAPDEVGLSTLARKLLAAAEQPALPLAAATAVPYRSSGEVP